MNEEKVCNKCGKTLPLTEFHRNVLSRDGRQAVCKKCRSEERFKRLSESGYNNALRGSADSPLANFTPRELINELKARGYRGTLEYTQICKL